MAVTERIPLASMSNFTSICGTPRGAGGIPSNRKLPKDLLSLTNSRSPCSTFISTLVWPSAAVEKTSDFEVGKVVFLGIIFVITPPSVSKPKTRSYLNGGSKSNNLVWINSDIRFFPSHLLNKTLNGRYSGRASNKNYFIYVLYREVCISQGILNRSFQPAEDECKTKITQDRKNYLNPIVKFEHILVVNSHLSSKSEHKSSNLALVKVVSMCFGPVAVAVIKGKLQGNKTTQ
ncbi:translation elongation factor EF1A [Striga asiatica]|uniref:Translation elongation factor EF1A n=1 Tax=Striga asiatica TaxID=4170 RepID=A0A5A7P3Y3_STRAF|nr:translation elongation factor EF1A [Striga asiatica]